MIGMRYGMPAEEEDETLGRSICQEIDYQNKTGARSIVAKKKIKTNLQHLRFDKLQKLHKASPALSSHKLSLVSGKALNTEKKSTVPSTTRNSAQSKLASARRYTVIPEYERLPARTKEEVMRRTRRAQDYLHTLGYADRSPRVTQHREPSVESEKVKQSPTAEERFSVTKRDLLDLVSTIKDQENRSQQRSPCEPDTKICHQP